LEPYIIISSLLALPPLGMAWMPAFTKATKISYSILYVAMGAVIYLFFSRFLPLPDPLSKNNATLRLTELIVIISLMDRVLKSTGRFRSATGGYRYAW
jgi:hypothetical protein